MENTISTTLKHKEHREWMSLINHYQDEIKFFQNELFLVATKHPDLPSIQEHVDEYRGLFQRKLQKIDDLRHRIAAHESQLASTAKRNMEEMHSHTQVREEIQKIELNFEQLKTNFRRFASRND